MPVASALPMRPEASRRPAIRISATASMMPEPQMPVTPVSFVASAKPGSVDQRSEPMTLKRGSFVARVDLDPFDGAGGGALAGTDLRALEGGTGGGGAGEHALVSPRRISALVPTSTTSVSSVCAPGPRTARRRRRRRPHGPRCRAGGRPRGGRDPGKVEVPRVERDAVGGGQREGRLAQFHRVDAQQQVVHHRVADDDQFEDEAGVDPGLLASPLARSPIAARTACGHFPSPPGFIMA
jgi:hypothetical protein